jgi:hypothetical protein
MISSNLNRFNDISAPEMPLLLDEHRLTSPPLSPESASSQSLHQYTVNNL